MISERELLLIRKKDAAAASVINVDEFMQDAETLYDGSYKATQSIQDSTNYPNCDVPNPGKVL